MSQSATKHIYHRQSYGREYLEVGVRVNGPMVYGGTFPISQLAQAKAARNALLSKRKSTSQETEDVHPILKEAW